MLETLDSVPWRDLTHAYGSAADVPGLIRGLASPRRRRRKAALYELYGNIWHQGTVYEATAYAVPFLVELAQSGSVWERHHVLEFLAIVANGSSYLDVHVEQAESHSYPDPLRDDPDYPAKLAREREWVRQARAAVLDGFPIYVKLLDDPEPDARMRAAYTLAALQERAAETVHALCRRLDCETLARPKACMLDSLGTLAGSAPDTLRRLGAGLDGGEHPFVRLAAATTLARVLGEATPSEAVTILIAAIVDPRLLKAYCRGSLWAGSESVFTAAWALRSLGAAVPRVVLPRLIAALESANPATAFSIARALFILAFERPREANTPVSEFDEEQKQVLGAIARSDSLWTLESKMGQMLRGHNLPERRDLLIRFLAPSAG